MRGKDPEDGPAYAAFSDTHTGEAWANEVMAEDALEKVFVGRPSAAPRLAEAFRGRFEAVLRSYSGEAWGVFADALGLFQCPDDAREETWAGRCRQEAILFQRHYLNEEWVLEVAAGVKANGSR